MHTPSTVRLPAQALCQRATERHWLSVRQRHFLCGAEPASPRHTDSPLSMGCSARARASSRRWRTTTAPSHLCLGGCAERNGPAFHQNSIARRGRRARGGRRRRGRARSPAVLMPRAPGKALRAHLANVGRKGQGCPCCTPNLIIRAETRCRRVGEEAPPPDDDGT